jgi:hypothetical protein
VVRLVLALAVVGALIVFPGPGRTTSASAATAPPYTLAVTPTSDLVDGQQVSLSLTLPAGETLSGGQTIRVCRPDGTYATQQDLLLFNGKCPLIAGSTSASPPSILPFADGSGGVGKFQVGVGTTTFGPTQQFSLTCDPTHPCRLVVAFAIAVSGASTVNIIDSSTLFTYSGDAPTASCGGNAPGALSSTGSDRLLAPWITLTKAYCAHTGQHQPTQAAFTGEGAGQQSYNAGTDDMVYSSVGRRFPGHDDEPKRDSVSVPVALDAAVIGVFGGFSTDDPKWPSHFPKPFGDGDIKITMAEAATILGQSPDDFSRAYTAELQARNPTLTGNPVVQGLTGGVVTIAPTAADGSSWLASSAFAKEAGAEWHASTGVGQGNTDPGAPRGPIESFALAENPPFSSTWFSFYSNRSSLQKTQITAEGASGFFGPQWVLTDLATATYLGIPTVSIQNSRGEFVAPTTASLQAATATMTAQPDGTELPDIGNDAPGAYPLTFVEHAVAPHEPLLDTDCTPRTDSQQQLTGWLNYLTSDGQAQLSDGLAPLPASMLTAAKAQVPQVGAAPVTGQCASGTTGGTGGDGAASPTDLSSGGATNGITGLPSDVPGSTGSSGGSGSTGGSGGSTSGGGGSGGSAANGGAGGGANANGATAIKSVDEGGLPGFGGGAASVVGGTVALLALALVGGIGGYVSSKRTAGTGGSS